MPTKAFSSCKSYKTSLFKDANLGLAVKPAQIRLITTSDNLCGWKVLPVK
jgi:hypothetical protein